MNSKKPQVKVVYKYMLGQVSAIKMPKGAQILTVKEQGDEIFLWALVDPLAESEQRNFVVFGTGHEIYDYAEDGMKYLGTVHLDSGRLVFHVFELLK